MAARTQLEHVVVVTDSLSVDGGSAQVALASAAGLARAGIAVTVFAAGGSPSVDLLACPNLRVISTGQGGALASRNPVGAAIRGLWNDPARERMARLLTTLDPERTVVHVHGWTKALSASVVGSAVRARFPIVVTLHEYFTACPTGCLYLHRDRQVCTIRPMSAACIRKDCDSRSYAFKLYRVLRQLIQRGPGRIPSGIRDYIVVSDFSRTVLEPLLPVASRFHAVANPVEAERRPRVSAERNRPYVYVGRFSPEKGATLFAEAARRADVDAVFIGDGPDRAEIARIHPRAVFTGWLGRDAVTAELRRARCVVVPSLWYETLGLVVLEAAALGVPAIVPTGTAPGALVAAGTTGLSFQRGSAADLADQLRACEDATLVEQMSGAAYDHFWRTPSTMSTHVARLLATYDRVLTEAPVTALERSA